MTNLFRNTSPGALTREQAVALGKKRWAEHQRQMQQARDLAAQGRGEDTEIAHVARGEFVVPEALQTPEVLAVLCQAAANANIPLERLRIGSRANSINPNTGAPEFGGLNWSSFLPFGNDDKDADQSLHGGIEGAATRAAQSNIDAANVREQYVNRVHALGINDSAERDVLKNWAREITPGEYKALTEQYRPGTAPLPGSGGRANVTNPRIDATLRTVGKLGHGLGAANIIMGAADIATSDNPVRSAVANVGAMGGGLLGGLGGAMLGPAAPVTAPAGAFAGGMAGYEGGERLYDYFAELARRRR